MSDRCVNATAHAVDLDDGRLLVPGQVATKVDLSTDRHKALLEEGVLVETEAKKPRKQTREEKA